MIAELYGGPYDGATWPVGDIEAPVALTFAAARAIVGWDIASISETTYALLEVADRDGDIARYEHVP